MATTKGDTRRGKRADSVTDNHNLKQLPATERINQEAAREFDIYAPAVPGEIEELVNKLIPCLLEDSQAQAFMRLIGIVTGEQELVERDGIAHEIMHLAYRYTGHCSDSLKRFFIERFPPTA